ncbi:MAG: SRPBCC family protein [Ilumatobacter sp.]|nr:SRPBCC family protein [Ilumatobacter sp.]
MAEVVGTAVIETGVEPIWNLMCDPPRYPDFVEATERMVDEGSGEFGVGYVYKEHGGLKPFIGESEWRVTEFEPMRHQTHLGDDGKVRLHLDIELEPLADDRTKLSLRVEVQPRWFVAPVMAVMWPLVMRKRAQEDMDTTAANAKRLVEASQ